MYGPRRRYYIHNGNNADLIRKQFRDRKGWSPAARPSELKAMNQGKGIRNMSELGGMADFVWCQYKSNVGDYTKFNAVTRSKKNKRDACVVNHFENNRVLVSKCGLYTSLLENGLYAHDKVSIIPWTVVLHPQKEGTENTEQVLLAQGAEGDGIYIIKPGQGTNRGMGIVIVKSLAEVRTAMEQVVAKGSKRKSWIVQKYIERPMLLRGRKFDIRCFVLLVQACQNSDEREQKLDGYLHTQAYLRTSGIRYTLDSLSNRFVHLTNDAVQSKSKTYGACEQGNKLSLAEFSAVLDAQNGPGSGGWVDQVCWPEISKICAKTLDSVQETINPNQRPRCFELYGFDFMVTEDRLVQLIEVNENPCLEQVCPLLRKIIPKVVDDTFKIVSSAFFGQATGDTEFVKII